MTVDITESLPAYFPAKIHLAQLPTPLQKLQRFCVSGAPNIWLKRDDLTGFTLSGNKVRKLEFVLSYALSQGVQRIITCGGMQSNHCRATALACAQLGLKCHLVLRDTGVYQSGGNRLLGQMAGAESSVHVAAEYSRSLKALLADAAARYEAKGEKVMVIPTGASDGLGIWGYAAAAFELLADFKSKSIEPSHVVCATGSGGTQAGLSLGFALAGSSIQVVGMAVCDSTAYFQKKVSEDLQQWSHLNPGCSLPQAPRFETVDRYVGAGYAKPGAADLALAVEMATQEGVLLDPVYTGKAFYGLVEELKAGWLSDQKDVVFVHTGGGFGTFPYEQAYQDVLAVRGECDE